MQSKNRQHQEYHHHEEKRLSPVDIRSKMKKNKDGNIKSGRGNREGNTSNQVKHHLASKSALETYEHVHYNSPNMPQSKQVGNQSTTPFTFTQIIQQSAKNQQKINSSKASEESYHFEMHNFSKESLKN